MLAAAATVLLAFGARADDALALTYYRQAEHYFQKERDDEALNWYRKAIEQRAVDGPVLVEERTVIRTVTAGRRAYTLSHDDTLYEDYMPNLRIQTITERQERQRRLANPPVLSLAWVTLRDPTRDNVLDGGETATIVVNLRNGGGSVARNVHLTIVTSDPAGVIFQDKPLVMGNVEPGASVLGQIEVHAQKNIAESDRRLLITATEQDGFGSPPLEVVLHTRPHRPARVQIVDISVKDRDNNNLIEPRELIRIAARVQNTGAGVAENVSLQAQLGPNVFLGPESEKLFLLGNLYPGDVRDIRLDVLTNTQFRDGQRAPVALAIDGGEGYDAVRQEVELTIHVSPSDVVTLDPVDRPPVGAAARVSVDVDLDIPQGMLKRPNAIAVVIGNKDYGRANLPGVEYALRDAKVMKDYLVRALGFSEHNIIYLENATAARFNETFGSADNFAGRLFSIVTPDVSEVFIYYSGHGAPDPHGNGAYFLPVDANPNFLALSGYALATLYNNLARLPAREITLVLDTCFSGNSAGGALLKNTTLSAANRHDPIALPPRTALFTSAAEGQVSAWLHEQRHGLYTYWFLKGLSGIADSNQDGTVTTSELQSYVSAVVPQQARRLSGQDQTPRLLQSHDMALIQYRAGPPLAVR